MAQGRRFEEGSADSAHCLRQLARQILDLGHYVLFSSGQYGIDEALKSLASAETASSTESRISPISTSTLSTTNRLP